MILLKLPMCPVASDLSILVCHSFMNDVNNACEKRKIGPF